MGDGTGRTWSLGWSVHLPEFKGPARKYQNESMVHMMSPLINFGAARKSRWFKESLDHLEGFLTGQGTFRFPSDYLQETNIGYWINGVRMALEGDRRTGRAMELESTFWMAQFHKLLSSAP